MSGQVSAKRADVGGWVIYCVMRWAELEEQVVVGKLVCGPVGMCQEEAIHVDTVVSGEGVCK